VIKSYIENEARMNEIEKSDRDSPKKKDLEAMLKQMRDDYLRKMNSFTTVS